MVTMRMLLVLTILLVLILAVVSISNAQGIGITTRVSVASDGTEGNDSSHPLYEPPSNQFISADGRYVAFSSGASNLVGNDTNNYCEWTGEATCRDIFVHDRYTGQTTRISIASNGTEGNEGSGQPSISADGRYVAFSSYASNLVGEDTDNDGLCDVGCDTNDRRDVFAHDRDVDEDGVFDEVGQVSTTLVSVSSDGTQGNNGSEHPSISADGHYVAFRSYDYNLGCTWGGILVHDRYTGQAVCVAVGSYYPSISADGRYVAFMSGASDIVGEDTDNDGLCDVGCDTNGQADVFVYDRDVDEDDIFDEAGQVSTIRVSVASDGTQGNNYSADPSISADGRYVAFTSYASNLVGEDTDNDGLCDIGCDTNNYGDIFVYDRQTGQTTRNSVSSNGTEGGGGAGPSVSADGRYVTFTGGSGLVSDDTNETGDIFVRDRDVDEDGIFDEAGQVSTTIVSLSSDGTQGDDYSENPSISADGRYVAFNSLANNLVGVDTDNDGICDEGCDTNDRSDVFVYDRWGISCSQDEWHGEYYDNRDLQGSPVVTRCDPQIDFYWGTGSPALDVPNNDFSVRWGRTIEITPTGWYHFRTFTDDGVRLYVDGEKIIDDWIARSFMEKSALKKLDQGSHQVTMEYVEWSNDAMAHLNWYRSLLCPASATACTFNITPMYQTQYLDKPMPEGCSTTENQTIARWGCLITSYAMAFRTLGINTDPDNLNHLLSNEVGAYLNQCNATLQGPGFVTKVISDTYGTRLNYVPVRTIDDAKSALRNGRPVIMRYSFNPNNKHFFLAVDISEINGQEYLGIIDPHHAWACQAVSAGTPPPVASQLQCSGSTLQHISTTQERFTNSVPVYYLEPAAQPQLPILQLYVRGAEALVTDNQDRRVGFEQATETIVYEVPNSLYYDAEIVPPGGVSDGIIQRTVFLPETPGGDYSLQVVGEQLGLQAQATSDFEINIVGFDTTFEAIATQVFGTVASGGTTEYQISFDLEQGTIAVTGGTTQIYLPIILK